MCGYSTRFASCASHVFVLSSHFSCGVVLLKTQYMKSVCPGSCFQCKLYYPIIGDPYLTLVFWEPVANLWMSRSPSQHEAALFRMVSSVGCPAVDILGRGEQI